MRLTDAEVDSQYLIAPNIGTGRLTRGVSGTDQNGQITALRVVEERPLSIFMNATEVVTAMTIGDYPEYLALGFLYNQGMLNSRDQVESVDYEEDIETVVVRTTDRTNYERKLEQKVRTSGCAMGTIFGDMYDMVQSVRLPETRLQTSWMYSLSRTINRTPSLYLSAGAIHGTVLCKEDRPLVYMEDVGRHNAVDKIAGWMLSERVPAGDKLLYTTGRLTSEMILKTAMMGIPVLISRSGFTAWGVDIAKEIGLTLIGRLRGRRFVCLAGEHRLVRDANPHDVLPEDPRHVRKAARA